MYNILKITGRERKLLQRPSCKPELMLFLYRRMTVISLIQNIHKLPTRRLSRKFNSYFLLDKVKAKLWHTIEMFYSFQYPSRQILSLPMMSCILKETNTTSNNLVNFIKPHLYWFWHKEQVTMVIELQIHIFFY